MSTICETPFSSLLSNTLSRSSSTTPDTLSADSDGSCFSHTDVESDFSYPVQTFFPSGCWLDICGLRNLRATIFALVVRQSATVQGQYEEPRSSFVQRALGVAEEAGLWCAGMQWVGDTMDVSGKQLPYYISMPAIKRDDNVSPDLSTQYVDEPLISMDNALRMFSFASLHVIVSIPSQCTNFVVYFLERPPVAFRPLRSSLILPAKESSCVPGLGVEDHDEGAFTTDIYPFGVPTPSEWRELWAMWDFVTLKMLPHSMLLHKPIDLRHKCLFYLGHIPTFVDMLLSKAIGGPPTEPAYFWHIFERGIDPHVDDPETCHHSHSDVPETDADWPSLGAVLEFRDAVRTRLLRVYDGLLSGSRRVTRKLARTLVMTLEHEGFHVETLLYMLIQRAGMGTLPPPGFTIPPWRVLAAQWDDVRAPDMPNPVLGPAIVVLGWDDPESEDVDVDNAAGEVGGHAFGWDNESPQRKVAVGPCRADWRPVSNGEYFRFWEEGGRKVDMPKSWVEEDGEIKVRTVYGPIPMAIARCWPVLASYDDLTEYAGAMGGRLPTEPELRLFLDTYEIGHDGGANVGFRNWHPVPATTGFAHCEGKGSNGGVWEWTSTLFDAHDGLVPTKLFTGYSVDFFDGQHQVVLGASYATIPRLAGRRTLRNFYQHNYPYAWVGARVVYDV